MERLHVENFLVIKKAELNLNPFCVVIGPQASGKSLLARLVHLFREFFDESTRKLLLDTKDDQTVNLEETMAGVLRKSFSEYFPGLLRGGHPFLVDYRVADFSVVIEGGRGGGENGLLDVEFSKGYLSFLEGTSREFKRLKRISHSKNIESLEGVDDPLTDLLWRSPFAEPFRIARKNSVFIPASRAYFASLQKNIFSIVRAGISLDPLIVTFGVRYEFSKEKYQQDAENFLAKAEPLFHSILAGNPVFSEGEDWIVNPNGRVKLQHASSGQQEALPMLVVLSVFAGYMPKGSGFIIEEPEAHLYPKAQKDIVSLFGLISNQRQLDFLITTHSPYILAALNNLILAGEVKEATGAEALGAAADPDFALRFADVSAYALTDGVLHSILDEEEKLIGVNAIDGVSDEFSDEFEALLELREAGERGAYSG